MLLYHYTSVEHLDWILEDGFLKTVSSNISPHLHARNPQVVWLTTNPDPAEGTMGLAGSAVDKYAIQITVDVPRRDVHKWLTWAQARGINRQWFNGLNSAGGSGSWRVVERRIPCTEWVHIINRRTREHIAIPERNAA